ncbi:MAG: DUF4097 family beta strand repeat protein [Rubrobacter sp.]|nr:DUF4097 family beta strand repeat protein [Rubrobacter sp.]
MGEERRETFEVGGKAKIELKSLPSGRASFLPGEDGKVEVYVRGRDVEEFLIEHFGDTIELRAPEGISTRWDSFEVEVRMPEKGVSLSANVAAADVEVGVDIETLGFNSASGNLRTKNIEGDAGVNTASGAVEIEVVGGKLGVNTASGDIRVREAKGNLGANSASGDVRVESALADLELRSAAGDLEVGNYAGGDLRCTTQAGDIKISVPPGRTLEVDMNTHTGDIRNELGESEGGTEDEGNGATAHLRMKTLSGDITLARA